MSYSKAVSNSAAGGRALPPIVRPILEEPANEARSLNALIVGLLDHVEEHRRAIFAVETRLNWMQRRLYDRVRAIEDLQTHVRSLGAQPAMMQSPLAQAVAAKLACEPYAKNNEGELMEDTARSERSLRHQIDAYLARGRLSESGRSCVLQVLAKMNGDQERTPTSWCAQLLGSNALRP